jgi:hypothetical protein
MKKNTIKYPLEQIWDDDTNTCGHLFEPESARALCGRKKDDMSAPVCENMFETAQVQEMTPIFFQLANTCKKCSVIALKSTQQ